MSDLSQLPSILRQAPLSQIGDLIRREWQNPSSDAVPYIRAMLQLPTIDSTYGAEDGRSIVLYFLSNASTWKGPIAKIVKAELRARVAH